MYDLIGDIHGHADQLVELLDALGYKKKEGVYRHRKRQMIFLGDFIDRGPRIRDVLEIVRPMVEEKSALAVMGNHELNALAYHTEDSGAPGEFLRRRTKNNVHQHSQTMLQLTPSELTSYLEWFRTLPVWLELDGLRAVHACWDPASMSTIQKTLGHQFSFTDQVLHSACRPGNDLFEAIEIVLKGKEAALPDGVSFDDKEGHQRRHARVRWYLDPASHTYRTYAMTDKISCDRNLDESVIARACPYPPGAKPVFFGHYWLSDAEPRLLAHNVACLDFSVAKGGFLCAYRWNGESQLDNDQFIWTRSSAKE